ncbi:MAG TPA: DUF3592 domain-containing protein [Xanthobacteraceae bacterium]|nr:DUF3592 domain-containing protein [Xanthobacteraceae bacterium]
MLFHYAILLPLIAAVALGALFALKTVSLLRKIAACTRWPTVTGKVIGTRTESYVDDNTTEATDSDHPHRGPGAETEYTGAIIRYAFSVAGRGYQSTRRYVGRPVLSGSPRGAAKVLAKYPLNGAVTVHYNPANPAEAMLEPANLANVWLALAVAVVFGGIGSLALWLLWSLI